MATKTFKEITDSHELTKAQKIHALEAYKAAMDTKGLDKALDKSAAVSIKWDLDATMGMTKPGVNSHPSKPPQHGIWLHGQNPNDDPPPAPHLTFDSYDQAEAYKNLLIEFTLIKLESTNPIKKEMERLKALGAVVGQLGGAEHEALGDHLEEILAKQKQAISDALTGMGNQCFYMENLEPFVKYATGDEIIVEGMDEIIKKAFDAFFEAKLEDDPDYKAKYGFATKSWKEGMRDEVRWSDEWLEKQDLIESNIDDAAIASGIRRGGYGNKHLKLISSKDHPELLINSLLSPEIENMKEFQRGTPAMYSALVPKIKIFKVQADGGETQLPFSTRLGASHTDPTEMLENRKGRADDVGLVGLDFDYVGGTTGIATHSKVINLNLTLLFESVESLMAKRMMPGTKPGKKGIVNRQIQYQDLINDWAGKNATTGDGGEIKSADGYSIRLVLGYSAPKNIHQEYSDTAAAKKFFDAAKDIKTSLNLSLTEYNLDFKETGQLEMTFSYAANVEDRLNYPEFNIFGNEVTRAKERLRRATAEREYLLAGEEEDLESAKGAEDNLQTANALAKIAESNKKLNKPSEYYIRALNEVYHQFKQNVMNRVNKIQLTNGDIQNYLFVRQSPNDPAAQKAMSKYTLWNTTLSVNASKMAPASFTDAQEKYLASQYSTWSSEESYAKAMADLDVSDTAKAKVFQRDPSKPGHVNMYWVYFGDLIAACMEMPNIKEELDRNNIDVALGQAVVATTGRGNNNQGEPRLVAVNIGDLPISLDYFNDWFRDRIVYNKVSNISFHQFVKDLVSSVLSPTIVNSGCKTSKSLQGLTTGFQMSYYTAKSSTGKKKSIFDQSQRMVVQGDSYKDFVLKNPTSEGPITRKDRKDIILIHAIDGGILSGKGNEENDAKLGIMHFGLAKDRGLLKSCSLSKTDIPKQREMIAAKSVGQQNSHETARLWNVYNADINLYGNPNMLPFKMIYLDPSMPGIPFGSLGRKNSTASALKIGGYYRVMEVSHTISLTGWETSAKCQYEHGQTLALSDAMAARYTVTYFS